MSGATFIRRASRPAIPYPSSVILWTRRPFESGWPTVPTVEVAEDDAFRRVVANASAPVSPESDWTTRVLVGHLKPARVYLYCFTDGEGKGSGAAGRSLLAELATNDPRPVNFSFVSCQSLNEGKLNGYRIDRQADTSATGPDRQGRRQPGMVRIHSARVKAPWHRLDTFGTVAVKNVPIENWNDSGLDIEPNNLKAINSLIAYRTFALRPAPRSHSHRPAQLLRRRSDRCRGR